MQKSPESEPIMTPFCARHAKTHLTHLRPRVAGGKARPAHGAQPTSPRSVEHAGRRRQRVGAAAYAARGGAHHRWCRDRAQQVHRLPSTRSALAQTAQCAALLCRCRRTRHAAVRVHTPSAPQRKTACAIIEEPRTSSALLTCDASNRTSLHTLHNENRHRRFEHRPDDWSLMQRVPHHNQRTGFSRSLAGLLEKLRQARSRRARAEG